jgi:hypothetical protein
LPPRVEDSAGGPGRIGVWGRKVAGMVWATADRPPGVRTEVGAMSRSFEDIARTVRSARSSWADRTNRPAGQQPAFR